MNSILMAAARGARVQYKWAGIGSHPWQDTTAVSTEEDIDYLQRIHPDDEHLRFGPISTALREMAVVVDRPAQDEYWRMARDYYLINIDGEWPDNDLHHSLFLLILSEALAEEGL